MPGLEQRSRRAALQRFPAPLAHQRTLPRLYSSGSHKLTTVQRRSIHVCINPFPTLTRFFYLILPLMFIERKTTSYCTEVLTGQNPFWSAIVGCAELHGLAGLNNSNCFFKTPDLAKCKVKVPGNFSGW